MARDITWDRELDLAFVCYREGPDALTIFLADGRSYELSSEGEVVGVEFQDVSRSVDLTGLPVNPLTLAPELEALGIEVHGFSVEFHRSAGQTRNPTPRLSASRAPIWL